MAELPEHLLSPEARRVATQRLKAAWVELEARSPPTTEEERRGAMALLRDVLCLEAVMGQDRRARRKQASRG